MYRLDADLIYRYHIAETKLDVSFVFVEVDRLLAMSFASLIPSSKTLDAEIFGDRILYFIGESSFLQFCLVCQNGSHVLTFLIQVPRMTNDRKGTCEHTAQLQEISDHIFCVSVFTPCSHHALTKRCSCRWNAQVHTVRRQHIRVLSPVIPIIEIPSRVHFLSDYRGGDVVGSLLPLLTE